MEKEPIIDNSLESRGNYYGEIPEEMLTPEKQKVMQEKLVEEFKKFGEKRDIMQIAGQVLKPKPILEVEILEKGVLHIIYGEDNEGDGKEDIAVYKDDKGNLIVKSFYFGFVKKSSYPSFGELLENPIFRVDELNRRGGKRGGLDYHDNNDK